MDPDLPDLPAPAPPAATSEALQAVLQRHSRRRQRLLSAGIVVALVAGLVGGWSLHRADDGTSIAATAESDDGAAGGGRSAPTPRPESASIEDRGLGHEGPPLERVTIRTTADDIALRLYRVAVTHAPCEPDLPCPPPDCLTTPLQVEVSNREATSVFWAEGLGAADAGTVRVLTHGTFGTAEGSPATVVVVDAGDGMASVAMTGGGGRDEAAVVDGVAALALPGLHPDPRIVGLTGSGAEIPAGAPAPVDCTPIPPTLPEEHDPPADRASAEAAVRDVVGHVFRSSPDADPGTRDILPFIEDGDELTGVQVQVQERYGDQEVEISIQVGDEITFQGAEHAAFRFTLVYNGGTLLSDHIGRAVWQDGRWKVARSMWCSMIERGGISCG